MNSYEKLLIKMCDGLIATQVSSKIKQHNGGFLCPACLLLHGRNADAFYPLICAYRLTGNKKYYNAAINVFDWCENTVSQKSGAINNDRFAFWQGITVFYVQSLFQALIYHADVLKPEHKKAVENRAKKGVEFLIPFIKDVNTAINYGASTCGALALAYKYFGLKKYKDAAKKYRDLVIGNLNEEGFLVGEALKTLKKSASGAQMVDMGYNFEESLCALVDYCNVFEDKELSEKVEKAMLLTAEFVLPDGGIDNSFGTRISKWTYWGSRTSDGCMPAFLGFANRNKIFGEVAKRNFNLIKSCVGKDGLLYGGVSMIKMNEPPCIHHTFCHAKSVAYAVDHPKKVQKCLLPTESLKGIKFYKTINSYVVNTEDLRVTFANNDSDFYHDFRQIRGAVPSLIYHKKLGVISAASYTPYMLAEPTNMQISLNTPNLSNTIRLEAEQDGKIYSDIFSKPTVTQENNTLTAFGNMETLQGESCGIKFTKTFDFSDGFTACFKVNRNASLYLPIVASKNDTVVIAKNQFSIITKKGKITVNTSAEPVPVLKDNQLNFNPSGGFSAFIVKLLLKADKAVTVKFDFS